MLMWGEGGGGSEEGRPRPARWTSPPNPAIKCLSRRGEGVDLQRDIAVDLGKGGIFITCFRTRLQIQIQIQIQIQRDIAVDLGRGETFISCSLAEQEYSQVSQFAKGALLLSSKHPKVRFEVKCLFVFESHSCIDVVAI